jgi:hypothetical protein
MPPSPQPTVAPSIKHSSCNLFRGFRGPFRCPCGNMFSIQREITVCPVCANRIFIRVEITKGVKPKGAA